MGARKIESHGNVVAGTPTSASSGVHGRLLVRPVLEHPDALLARVSREINPRSTRALEINAHLVATMRASPGCLGLSAPQIGEDVRMFVMDVTGHKKARSCAGLVVLANPRVLWRSGNVVMREGCLSVPDFTGDVERPAELIVSGVVPGTGEHIAIAADGIEARCILHEIDHLDGVLFVDRTSRLHPRTTY